MAKMGSFKNQFQSSMLSKEISSFYNRGFASADKVQTVLNEIRETAEIRHLKNLDESKVLEIAEKIAEKVALEEIAGKTGATYISALNQIVDYANFYFDKDLKSLNYSDFDIHKETNYADRAISEQQHQNFQNFLQENFEKGEQFQALSLAVELQREFGLRFRESAGLNEKTIAKALQTGKLELGRQDWTKNARERTLEVQTEAQREALQKTQNFLENSGKTNLAGAENAKSYREISRFRAFADSVRTEFSGKTGEKYNYHAERHAYAQRQYSAKWEQKTGTAIQSPIQYYSERLRAQNWNGEGKFYDAVSNHKIKNFLEHAMEKTGLEKAEIKKIDKEIRMEISEALGHSRLDITNTYLGHL